MSLKPSCTYEEELSTFLIRLFLSFYLVIAVIAATLFPLWPAEMRVGVYYLSVGAGCFVASILLLAVGKCQSSSFYQQVKSKRVETYHTFKHWLRWVNLSITSDYFVVGSSQTDPGYAFL